MTRILKSSGGALEGLRKKLRELASEEQAAIARRYFKTGPGQYGEGDQFIGIRVPALRATVKEFPQVSKEEAAELLISPIHAERFLALLFLMKHYRAGEDLARKWIHECYLSHTRYINNWDLVDVSAEHLVGEYLLDREKTLLYRLAASELLWERRIAIIATFCYIRRGSFDDTLALAERLLGDPEDLMHKAVGWMLREVGKRDTAAEEYFLKRHYRTMPRTMLRYAIEKFPEPLRKGYLAGTV